MAFQFKVQNRIKGAKIKATEKTNTEIPPLLWGFMNTQNKKFQIFRNYNLQCVLQLYRSEITEETLFMSLLIFPTLKGTSKKTCHSKVKLVSNSPHPKPQWKFSRWLTILMHNNFHTFFFPEHHERIKENCCTQT